MASRRSASSSAVAAAAAVLIASAGAGTQPAQQGRLYLMTNDGVIKYLVSEGIDPKGVVIQRGSQNYAGPHCPGKGWHCTSAKRVVQLSFAPNNPGGGGGGSGTNQFMCTESDDGSQTSPNECLIVQSSSGTDNNATCVEKIGDPTGTQSCRIYQLNTTGANDAVVQQSIAAAAAPSNTQDATQVTEIGQWNAGGSNSAQVNQDLKESQSVSLAKNAPAITQQQDGHQTASVGQHSGTGDNTAKVLQSLQLKASATGGTSITQRQDTSGSDANSNAAVYQNSDQDSLATPTSTGTNNAYVFQSNDLNASGAKTGSLNQQQGANDTGLNVYVDQRSTGVSTTQLNQNEHQSLGASQVGTLSQLQIGPMWADPNQANNPANTFTSSQSSDQNAGSNADQEDNEYGECGSSGTCKMTQKVANDKQNGTNSCVGSSCDISLTASSGEGGVQTCSDSECFSGAPPTPPDPLASGGNFCEFLGDAPPCVELLPTETELVSFDCSTVGNPVNFSVTVTPFAVTGTVDFKEGATVLDTEPLDDGTATYSTSTLPLGPHVITAVYSGDSTYAGSTSPSVTHTVISGPCIG